MPTTHFRNGQETVVLAEQPTTAVPAVIAELAEVLVASQLATQDNVAELRLAIETAPGEFQDITQSSESLQSLGVTNDTVIVYKFGDSTQFGYEVYAIEQ